MKRYRFNLSTWASEDVAKVYRAILKDWIIENGGVKTPLYVKSDVYVWATDKDMLHMVIESEDWNDLPSRLSEVGSDVLDFLVTAIEDRDVDEYSVEQQFLDYLEG